MSFANSRLSLQFGASNPGEEIVNWEEYSYDADFMTPCDAFSMKVGDKSVTEEMRAFMQGGQQVKLFVQFLDSAGNVLSQRPVFTGFLDKVEQNNDRGGTFFTLHGRNILGPLCDSGIDPWSNTYKFAEGQTLGDVMGKVFSHFSIRDFFLTDVKNRQITTGIDKNHATLKTSTIKVTTVTDILSDKPQTTETTETVTQWIDPTNTYDLAEKTIKKLQPLHDETYMQFVERNLQRFNLHCWAMSDGSGVVIGQPDYTQEPMFKIINVYDGQDNNVLSGRIEIDYSSQPSIIIAKGFQGGGDFQNTRIRTAKVNEFIGYTKNTTNVYPEVDKVIKQFKGLVPIAPTTNLINTYSSYFTPPAMPRVIFWEDAKSRTLHQLEGAVRRKMSQYQSQALKLHYTVQDHIQDKLVWKHNTIATVTDQVLGINNQPFWVLSVSYKKSRTRGTTTDLVLVPVGTIQFGPP